MINIEKHYIELTQKLSDYKKINSQNISSVNRKNNIFFNVFLLLQSVCDVLVLLIKLNLNKNINLIYTAPGYCNIKNGKHSDRILSGLNIENRVYINQSKESIIKSIDNYKVYNIGGVIKLVSFFYKKKNSSLKYLSAYSFLNNLILKNYKGKIVYLICYYDANGFSVVNSKYRNKFHLIEIQHGNMINYPPYTYVSDSKIADEFYVKNQGTIDYLKKHLNKNYPDILYQILPYPKQNTTVHKGIHILYASTLEFNGIHPLFMDYLHQVTPQENVTVYVRLHPREKKKKELFDNQIKNLSSTIIFDESPNWLETNSIKNLIIISPWSSVIEEAHDNGYASIIVDPKGLERFTYLLDNKTIYVDSVSKMRNEISRLNTITS